MSVVSALTSAASRAAVELHALREVRHAGMLGLEPPQRTARVVRALARYGTLGAGLPIAALREPHRAGIVDELGELTFEALDRRSNAVANRWRALGAGAGSGVGILCRNHRGFIDATFGAAKIGGRAVLLNTDFAGPQLREVCEREGVELLVHDEEFAEIAEGARVRRGRFLAWVDGAADGETLDDVIAGGDPSPPPPADERGRVILLTSGTTGMPKGAPREQGASLAPLGALLSKVPLRAGEVTYIAPPMFHALGFAHAVLAIGLGSTIVTRRRFNAEEALAGVADHGCTTLIVVPAQLQRILALGEEAIRAHDLSALRIVFVAGSQLEGPLATRALSVLGDKIYNMYGSTEVAWATFATPEDLSAAPGCAGRPPFGTVVRLYDGRGTPVEGVGRTGRIFVGNGAAFEGYTGGGTKEVVDGLMSTGDVGHFDAAGRLFIDGRDDDMIVSGGENVFPGEVEELLAGHDAIAEAAVIGVADEDFGQRLKAFVVRLPGESLDEQEVKDFVRSNLARYKVPREVVFLDELPRNPTGKVLKRRLAELGASETAA